MKNTVERFSNRVENYAKYRPGYPREVLHLFCDEMRLQKNSVIADVGSGTGLSAKLFLENGYIVFGVEPNEWMRRAAEKFLKDHPNFKSINGTAEATTLADKSVDFVIAAQAFHWFDPERTRIEFRRILRDNGFIALMWNERQLDTSPFLIEYEQFLLQFATDYEKVRHENISENLIEKFFQNSFTHSRFQNSQIFDFEGLKGRVFSASYMPAGDDPQAEEMLNRLAALFAKHAQHGKIEIQYDTNVFFTRL